MFRPIRLATLWLAVLLVTGCAVTRVGDQLAAGILDHPDPQLVRDGLPSYLLTLDGLVRTWPRSESLLTSAASLYGAYGSLFVAEPERRGPLVERGLDYAVQAACVRRQGLCQVRTLTVPELETELARTGSDDLNVLHTLGTVWASYIEVHSSDWNAVADLARVQRLLERVVALDEGWQQGQAHVYLGVLDSLLPAALGGQPEAARDHFERARVLSGDRNLMARTYEAEKYARMQFDQSLHDRLLQEVIAADPRAPGLTLQNVLAQQRARRLLDESGDYF